MNYSIRTRLTLMIALVFLVVLLCTLAAGAAVFYLEVTQDADAALAAESRRAAAYFEAEYPPLASGEESEERETLVMEFTEDLHELYGGTRRFAVFVLISNGPRQVFEGGAPQQGDGLANEAFSEQEGAYYRRFGDTLYRVQTGRHDWGVLMVGVESQILPAVAGQLGNILLIVMPVTLILVLAGGQFLARRAMRPVLAAARSAERITVTNLSERLPPYPGDDEFGTLLSTFNRMIERLETGVRRIQRFTQDAAHELRSPLAILRGELELSYQHDRLPDEVRDGLQKSLDRTIAMSKMVEDLMLLAQSDAGQFALKRTPVQFDVLVRDVMEDVHILAEDRDIAVAVEHCDPVACMGDEPLLRRLLLNLADNALKYTPAGRITITLKGQDARLEFSISDTGIGIPESDLPHVFDRFYRVDASRSRDNGGSGLGLAICKWIAVVHGGDIHIDSTVSRGTTVTLTLPLSP
jgi:heavy metal sensor kinase